MKIAVVSCSSAEDSVSRRAATAVADSLSPLVDSVEFYDVTSIPNFRVSDQKMNDVPAEMTTLFDAIGASDGVVFSYPIYCYTASGTTKAVTELLGPQLANKPVATVVAAGSLRSHLATGDLHLSMMFEQETFCFPRSVLVTRSDLEGETFNTEVSKRIGKLAKHFVSFTKCLVEYEAE
ncbi:NAD(P)H-dependent oxidoreductase [Epibacterium ulvae]|uniref:NAD(P)H-dependent oxidoreductase n=1 Tax=Epibacterium ulvae TaxID=1156985 RepID=UPI0024939A4E|nr:NAD(P)H-dependent oxidoreductase [Epibacterium ulvae]